MADYIDRQAAIAAIDKYAEYLYGLPRESIASEFKNIISMLPEPWVDATVQLPPEGVRCLTYCRFKHMRDRTLGTYRDGTTFFRPDGERPGRDISHWMPLPDAPEVREDG